jgi:hypothetical protein
LPALARSWPAGSPYRQLDATLVSVDLSGFTALSERLAQKGKAGAEELILVVSGCFEGLIRIASRHGGDVLKFRGDALLLLFDGDGHAARACRSAAQMQWFIENAGPTRSSVGRVSLRMSTGVHSGTCTPSSRRHASRTDGDGPATTETFRLEDASQAGEVLVSGRPPAVDPSWLGERREEGILLAQRRRGRRHADEAADGGDRHPEGARAQLAYARGEAEHRQATVAFLKYAGIDDVIAAEGAEGAFERCSDGDVVSGVCEELDLTWLESTSTSTRARSISRPAPRRAPAPTRSACSGLRAILDASRSRSCGRASTRPVSPATSARRRGARTRSWATRSTSRRGSSPARSRAGCSRPARCSTARPRSSRPRASRSS